MKYFNVNYFYLVQIVVNVLNANPLSHWIFMMYGIAVKMSHNSGEWLTKHFKKNQDFCNIINVRE